ncbi:MAG: pyruvate dehydrogenase complex dihydrolipoamide acetyltransferase [Alphaproteobacteria bacterium]
MPIEILMPALSPTMTEGNLSKWVKKEGDKVQPGDVIAEIETDKATMEVEAVDSGTLGKILIAEGTEGVAVNKLIALILEEGEDKSALENYAGSASDTKAEVKVTVEQKDESIVQPANIQIMNNNSDRIIASPLAKRIAANESVDLTNVKGTGPHGRIIKSDVLEAKSSLGPLTSSKSSKVDSINSDAYTKIPNNNMRKVIAKRLCESKQTVPHFYLSLECELDNLMKLREELNNAAAGEYKLSVNDFVIKASAKALKAVPAANSSWTEEATLQYNNVDISVAVAIEGGLITPIVRNADIKSLSTISNEMKDLAARAKAGKLAPEEFQGGGFSISNLGMFGIKSFNAIINPPQSCILAVGAGSKRVVVKDNEMKIATVMDVTLSVDHRVVDGAIGAEFLSVFKKLIENPILMLA